MRDLITPQLAAWLGATSLVMFLGSVWLIPIAIVRIPEDYFLHSARWHREHATHPVLAWLWWGTRNLLGAVLILLGIAMLVLPGQGVITILLGVLLTTIPGKRWMVLQLFRLPKVLSGVNWLRRRRGVSPLQLPDGAVAES